MAKESKENQKLSALKRAYNNNEQAALVFSLYEAAKVKGHFFKAADVTTTKDGKEVTEKETVITEEKLRDLEKALGIDHAKAADTAKGYICFLKINEAVSLMRWLRTHCEKLSAKDAEEQRKKQAEAKAQEEESLKFQQSMKNLDL